MDTFFSQDLGSKDIKSLNKCRGAMKAIVLSDLSTADGRYLEHFVFDPGLATVSSTYKFPREKPKGQLGYLGKFLAQLYNNRGETGNASRELVQ